MLFAESHVTVNAVNPDGGVSKGFIINTPPSASFIPAGIGKLREPKSGIFKPEGGVNVVLKSGGVFDTEIVM
jgi:hypothetical protein